ncbi:MAG TPA: glucose-6-phosphate isomerase [Acidimicrobiia bacterium]|nr:glucose-6-phosphate isomerase [Acidimicrobiia bacterium]
MASARGDAILDRMYESLTSVAGFDAAAIRWDAEAYPERLWRADPTIWSEGPIPELADRLGWLDLHRTMRPRVDDLSRLAAGLVDDGILDVVVCGMGGSSLAPDVFSQVLGSRGTHPKVTVLDSTHPAAVDTVAGAIDVDRSAFIISSKSGTTLETLSFFRYFWDRTGGDGSRFIAVTDPGTPLAELGHERDFREVVLAPADVGGRYSALTAFGLVPAAVMGVDLTALLDRAEALAEQAHGSRAGDDPAIALGLAWAAHARNGHDKLTFRTSPALASFPAWLEQLVAESLGKEGRGIIPVAGEPPLARYGYDRVFVDYVLAGESLDAPPSEFPHARLEVPDGLALGAEMLRAEIATAVAGEVMAVHPFDQPDVERAKQLAKKAMSGSEAEDTVAPVPAGGDTFRVRLERFLAQIRPGDYLALQAYLAPDPDIDAAADRFRQIIAEETECATTFGYGPRFLHSTGQLHKGGPNTGVFIQVIDRPAQDIPVPETDYTFGQIIAAQADGDYAALREADRRVLRVDVTDSGIEALLEALG